MAEEQRGGPIEISREPERLPVLRDIEERLSRVGSPDEALKWGQVREQIQRQDNFIREREVMGQLALQRHRDMLKEAEHRRFLEKAQVLSGIGVPIALVATGVGLMVAGIEVAGGFILGTGLFTIAPEFVRAFLPRRSRRSRGENNND